MIKNKINGKCYIGQAIDINARWISHRYALRHKKGSRHLQHAWDKYGENAFEFIIIEECGVEELDDREIYWISYYDSKNSGYNLTDGGGGMRGYKMSEESKRLISEACKGRKVSENHMKALRDGLERWRLDNPDYYCKEVVCITTGEIFPSRTEAANAYGISDGNLIACINRKIRWCGKSPDGERLVWVDYIEYQLMSDDDISNRIQLAYEKRVMPDEERKMRSVALSGKKKSKEHVAKMVESRRKNFESIGYTKSARFYVCLNTGDVFPTYSSIAQFIGMSSSLVAKHVENNTPYVYEDENGVRFVFVPKSEYDNMSDEEISNKLNIAYSYQKKRSNRNTKHIVCLNNGVHFQMVADAAKYAGVSAQSITNNLKHRVHSVAPDKNGNGLVFAYEDEYNLLSPSDIESLLDNARINTRRRHIKKTA